MWKWYISFFILICHSQHFANNISCLDSLFDCATEMHKHIQNIILSNVLNSIYRNNKNVWLVSMDGIYNRSVKIVVLCYFCKEKLSVSYTREKEWIVIDSKITTNSKLQKYQYVNSGVCVNGLLNGIVLSLQTSSYILFKNTWQGMKH